MKDQEYEYSEEIPSHKNGEEDDISIIERIRPKRE